jgi:hypothetical protein
MVWAADMFKLVPIMQLTVCGAVLRTKELVPMTPANADL